VKLEALQALAEVHKLDKNYQHRDKTWAQIDALAAESFDRLTADQKTKVGKVCIQYGLDDMKQVFRYRFLAQTNLFFLCKLLEKYKDVRKDPTVRKKSTSGPTAFNGTGSQHARGNLLLTTSCRTERRQVLEPTLFSASIEQSLTGFHVCVLKLDDVVTNENSLTIDRLKNVNKQVSINQAMLHPYGFLRQDRYVV
jgi:hypothetical protein